jgi:hypothetical protein
MRELPDEPKLQRLDETGADVGPSIRTREKLSSGFAGIGLAAIVLIIAGAWSVGLLPQWGPAPKAAPTVEMQIRPANSGPSVIERVVPADAEQAIAALMLSDDQKAQIRTGVASGKLLLGKITVSDFDTEDADWVSISGAGFRQDVRLFKKPLTVTVPYMPGVPAVVTGLIDGGGGDITVAIQVGAASMPLRALKPGEGVEIPTP